MIKVTPEAMEAVRKRLADKPETVGFRIYVQGFG